MIMVYRVCFYICWIIFLFCWFCSMSDPFKNKINKLLEIQREDYWKDLAFGFLALSVIWIPMWITYM